MVLIDSWSRNLTNAVNLFCASHQEEIDARKHLESVMAPKPVYGPPPRKERSTGPLTTITTLVALAATTVITTGVGSLFQYVSWLNSARVEDANSHAKLASELYEKIAQSIGKRYYSTYLYLAAARDIVNAPAGEGDLIKFYLRSQSSTAGSILQGASILEREL
jgi:hypothetical protein